MKSPLQILKEFCKSELTFVLCASGDSALVGDRRCLYTMAFDSSSQEWLYVDDFVVDKATLLNFVNNYL